MDFSTLFEVSLLFRSVCFGALCTVMCDVFKLVRVLFSVPQGLVLAQDLILCFILICAMGLFVFIYNFGIMRVYILFGAAAGAGVWFCTVSRLFSV